MAVSTTAETPPAARTAKPPRAVFQAWPPNLASDLTNQCRWHYVAGSGGWRECQHGHTWPPAAVMAKRSAP